LNSRGSDVSHLQQETAVDALDQSVEASSSETKLRYETTERILQLLYLLLGGDRMREDIFEHMKDFYRIGESNGLKVRATSQRVGRMLSRDIQALEQIGFQINKFGRGNTIRYNLVKGSGPFSPFLFSPDELNTLILLHTLFADPTKYTPNNTRHHLPISPPRNPYAESIVKLIERMVETLPAEQKKYFDTWVRKPFVYLNMDTVTDYLPHRDTINTLVKFISTRRQIQFEYTSMKSLRGTTFHEGVDPYYIIHQEGHLYLIGYAHKTDTVLEYRIDRIKAGSIKPSPQHKIIDTERRSRPIEFSYWLDGNIAKSGLSHRWLSQTIEREEVYIDTKGRQQTRVLVRAKAYSEWRILQQMHKYGDKAELADPPELREKMRHEVEKIYSFYQK
jgi:predicted DNA-binding transcriptional regulator YafY